MLGFKDNIKIWDLMTFKLVKNIENAHKGKIYFENVFFLIKIL